MATRSAHGVVPAEGSPADIDTRPFGDKPVSVGCRCGNGTPFGITYARFTFTPRLRTPSFDRSAGLA